MDDLQPRLAAWTGARMGVSDVTITDFKRHAEGFSWETYTFTAGYRGSDGAPASLGIAIRREPAQGTLEHYDASRDFRLLELVARHSSVPVPEPLWLEEDPRVLDRRFYATRRVEGTVPVPWAARDWEVFRSDTARTRLGREFVEILAQVHTIDPDATGLTFLGRPASAESAAAAAIDEWERMYEESAFPPVLVMPAAFRWLRAHLATSGCVGLVHGDFRIGNFMIDGAGHINAVFDWELAHLGDPVFDIAYSALRLYRGRSPLYSQLLPREEYFGLYAEHTGLQVSDEVFHFWTVLGYVRALAQHFRACRAFADGATEDLRLAAMSHRALHLMKFLAEEIGLRKAPA
jgi:aminoglycoside phosphotransferase (APT) family kinase protein